jgi:hypothetical protein
VGKIFAASLTLWIGGSGGVFAPSLFIGAAAGMAFGIIVHHLFGPAVGPPALYGVVAMGGVFAAAAQAPLTSIASVAGSSFERSTGTEPPEMSAKNGTSAGRCSRPRPHRGKPCPGTCPKLTNSDPISGHVRTLKEGEEEKGTHLMAVALVTAAERLDEAKGALAGYRPETSLSPYEDGIAERVRAILA